MNTLLFRLEGPLQAWGLRARWGERDTTDAPTKSGVIGLIGCALGLRRDDDRLRILSETYRFGVRIDRPGTLLRDYHATGGGKYGDEHQDGGTRYADQPYVGGLPSAQTNKGRVYVKLETDISNRFYLMDASFLAAMQGGSDAELEEIVYALDNPVWPYFLGRKSCVPSERVFAGVIDATNLQEALGKLPLADRGRWPVRALIESGPHEGNRQNDNVAVPGRRLFAPRYVMETQIDDPKAKRSVSINTLEG